MKFCNLYLLCLAALLLRCHPEAEKPVIFHKHKDTVLLSPVIEEKKPELPQHISYLDSVFQSYDLVNIHSFDSSICVDLRYADTNNFLKMNMYDGLRNAYLHCDAAIRLSNAQYFLKQEHLNFSLIIFDAARPKHIQQLMWDSLKMPPDRKFKYLTPPYISSMHNYGCAVDVSIINLSDSTLLDMGSDYDFFGKLSEPVYEWQFLKNGELSQTSYENRLLLRRVMKKAKFNAIHSEWWHFSICSKGEAVAKFKLIK